MKVFMMKHYATIICLTILAITGVGCTNNSHTEVRERLETPPNKMPINLPNHTEPPISTIPTNTIINDARSQGERITECGPIAFGKGDGKTNLPLRCIQANYGVNDPSNPLTVTPKVTLTAVPYSIPSGLHQQLAVYWMNLGNNIDGALLLAPKGWRVRSADVGANGSSNIVLENPEDEKQFIDYFDNGGCQGCLIANIGSYFPALKDWAEEQGFATEPLPEVTNRSLINPNLMAYSKKSSASGYELNGTAFQEHGGSGGIFRTEQVQLKVSGHALSTTILNLFVTLNPSSAK